MVSTTTIFLCLSAYAVATLVGLVEADIAFYGVSGVEIAVPLAFRIALCSLLTTVLRQAFVRSVRDRHYIERESGESLRPLIRAFLVFNKDAIVLPVT
jgi:hypothetical protein